MRIRISRVPTVAVEGIRVEHYGFCEGHVYDIGPRLAELLLVLGYAESESHEDRAPAPKGDG